jgi:hypothetical protein
MAITNAQQYKQLVNPPMKGNKRPGYRGPGGYQGGATNQGGAGNPGRDGPDDRGTAEQNRNQRNIVRDAKERQKIVEKIQKPTTVFQKVKRSPFFQAASFITNPLSFGLQKIMDSKRAKRINELFGVDDDLGYTGADAGFVNALPEPPKTPREGGDGPIIPLMATPYQQDVVEEAIEELSPIELALKQRDEMGGARAFAKEGGIMDLETGRQMYFLGKLVKKVKRGVKKIVKSPVGKTALAAAGIFKLGGGSFTNFIKGEGSGFDFSNIPGSSFLPSDSKDRNLLLAAAGLTAAPLLLQEDDTEDEYQEFLSRTGRGTSIDIQGIRNDPYGVLARGFYAEGGKPEPVAKKTLPLLDMGGVEKDYRADGGFVPIGRMEKADDVPARLSKNEFVFTADAVRNAGDGSVDKGAEVMYNMMKNLESGGEVSKESQGLDGARKMFQTSQRLEEVL